MCARFSEPPLGLHQSSYEFYSLNSLQGVIYIGDYIGDYYRVYEVGY